MIQVASDHSPKPVSSQLFCIPLRVFLNIFLCHAWCLPSGSLSSDPILYISYSLTAPIPQGHHDKPNFFEKREQEGTVSTPYLNLNPLCLLFFNDQTLLLPPLSSSISSLPSIQERFLFFFFITFSIGKSYFLLHIVSFPTLFLYKLSFSTFINS